jgi:hypothetical protein
MGDLLNQEDGWQSCMGFSAPNDDLRKGVFRIEERNIPEVVFFCERWAVGFWESGKGGIAG